ncbi:MAG: site-specific DNA-methyltransferase [Firmicutes bacterium]|jgi:adenine-specific DNA-methyltransferase|nr:site-specific DNA-methyltransferase [Bacillota bacterium]
MRSESNLKLVTGQKAQGVGQQGPEEYSFTWPGKQAAVAAAGEPARSVLVPVSVDPPGSRDARHMFIEGDNLEALKLLRETHCSAVKMIYIDPPYNARREFVYADNFGDRWAWLSVMYPRLAVAWELLRDDGVIFVSIDDHEVHHLRMIMNEIFGEDNFVAQIVWQSRQSVQNDTDISVSHEYITVYAKNRRRSDRRLKGANASRWNSVPGFAAYPLPLDPRRFSNPDGDPRGPWKADPFDAPNIRPNLTYPIVNPTTGVEHWPPPGRCWRQNEASFRELLADGRIVFGRTGTAGPQMKVFYREKEAFGKVENTWFDGARHGTAARGTREIQELFDGRAVFDSPKPTALIRSLLRIATRGEDIVLDFFAGSCTTAHAVLNQNREDGGGRRCMCIQAPEPTSASSTARQMGYNTIAEIGLERIRRVIDRMTSAGADPGALAFQVLRLKDRAE